MFRIKWHRRRFNGDWSKLHEKKWKAKRGVLLKSAFYKDLAERSANLEEYPIINKSVFMEHFDEINTVGIKLDEAFKVASEAEVSRDFSSMINGITIGLSSGTSGNRGVFLASEDERAQWVAAVLDRVIGFKLRKRTVAFFLRANSNLYDSVKSNVLRFEFFDLLRDLSEHIDRLNTSLPNILVAQPSMLIELAGEVEKDRLKISPEKIISVAEVLYEEDKKYLESVFQQKIHQVYQCTEGFLASTCEHGTLHFHEDFFIIEKKYIDEERDRFHPIITDLERSSQPVIRYELNDIIIEKESCPCGNDWIAIEAIEGRSDDVLRFIDKDQNNVRIYPDFFRRAIIMSNANIRDYALIQKTNSELELFVNGDDHSFEAAKNGVLNLLADHHVHEVSIERIDSNKTEKGNKLRRIRYDHR